MRVKSNISLVQANINFYCRLTSTSKVRTVDALRDFYFNEFMKTARSNMSKSIDLDRQQVSESIQGEGTFIDNITENVVEPGENEVEEQEVVSSAQGFLSAVKSASTVETVIQPNEDVKDIGSASGFLGVVRANTFVAPIVEEVVERHGLFLEDIIESSKEKYETSDHGLILDDVNVVEPVVQNAVDSFETSDRGIILDDIVIEETAVKEESSGYETSEHGLFLEDVEIEETSDTAVEKDEPPVAESLPDVHGIFLEDYEVNPSSETVEELTEEEVWDEDSEIPEVTNEVKSNVINFPSDNNDIGIALEISKADEPEVVNVPPTVREFLKKHPGSTVEFVEKYYSKKEIQKELKVGKIYKKGSKLFI